MDKAPDAFRTISEVADDLDIPQHVLRFWETRFSQIKPMKRSGGRRYYRPDDVDLLRGIRRLLYGEGYTIRGVQRILREQGIKAVQGLADETVTPPSPARRARSSSVGDEAGDRTEPDFDEGDLQAALSEPRADLHGVDDAEEFASLPDEDDEDDSEGDEDGLDIAAAPTRPAPRPISAGVARVQAVQARVHDKADPGLRAGAVHPGEARGAAPQGRGLSPADAARLKAALEDLAACKQLVDDALKSSPPGLFPLK